MNYEITHINDEYANYEGYINAQLSEFFTKYNLTDYSIKDWGLGIKDPQTGEFSNFYGDTSQLDNTDNIFHIRRIIDYDTNNIWDVYIPYFWK